MGRLLFAKFEDSKVFALMMQAASTSETSLNFTRIHSATSQKTAIFILVAVRI
jgi:hypothetical protein